MPRALLDLTPAQIRKAIDDDLFVVGDAVLYGMCRAYPDHQSPPVIHAKINLIGRAYAAAIERRPVVDAGMTGDEFQRKVVVEIIRKSRIDQWFAGLRQDPSSERVLRVHRQVTQLFERIAGIEKRSLASKYCHFHFPDHFFIYDSRSAQAIRQVSLAVGNAKKAYAACDPAYAAFYLRCRTVQADLQRRLQREYVTPKQLDKLLLAVYDRCRPR